MPEEEPDSNQVEDPEQYEELRKQEGVSREEAARKADSETENLEDEKDSPTYEKWTDEELEQKAAEADIEDYAGMDRQQMIDALRDRDL